MISIRPGKSEDIEQVCGGRLHSLARVFTVMDDDGESVAVFGVQRKNGAWFLFSDIKEGINASPLKIWRATLICLGKLRDIGGTFYAVPESEKSVNYLERLGFVQDGEVYKWHP